MTARRILEQRLHNQRLVRSAFGAPEDIVRWLGAVQSQDFAGACWAVAMRTTAANSALVEQAFDAGRIVRTHMMRPTWHFVTPADLRWIQRLTAARVRQRLAPYDRQLEINAAVVKKTRTAVERALEGGRFLTRAALATVLQSVGIKATGPRLAHLIMYAELDAVICSGPRQGKQFTYALTAERAPAQVSLDDDEARAELLRRYLAGHGPATLRDFVWWSGLTMRDAKLAAGSLAVEIRSEPLDGLTYWSLAKTQALPTLRRPCARLLPNYDEYLIAHQDRGLTAAPAAAWRLADGRDDIFAHVVVIDGRVAGMWRRRPALKTLSVDLRPYRRWSRDEMRAVRKEVERYRAALLPP